MTVPRGQKLVTAAGAVLGIVLFAWAVNRAGVDALLAAVQRVGWGLLLILAIGGARFMVRAQCWRWCLPPTVPLDFPHALSAYIAGDAVGNVTPLGLLVSEPTKVLLTRHHLATVDSIASLALENILYTISVMAMLGFGLTVLLITVPVSAAVRWTAVTALAVIGVVALVAITMLRMPVNAAADSASGFRTRIVRLRSDVSRFAVEHPGRLARVFSLQLCFHALAVVETFLALEWLLGAASPTLVQAILFETVNRLTTVVFKFVPFRIGVDEATSGAAASLFAVTIASGVALAVVRKIRVLFWSAIGLLLIATHPATSSTGTTPAV
jgi:hypothetical protein